MNTYEIRVWEKAEHWFFYEVVQADSLATVREMVRKMYKNGYVVMH